MKLTRSVIIKFILPAVVILAFHFFLLFTSNFRDFSDMFMYPWLLANGLTLYKSIVINYTPGLPLILKSLYDIIGYNIANIRVIAYFFIVINDILLYIISYRIFKNLYITLLVAGYYVYWQVLLEGNSIWFEPVYLPFLLLSFYRFWRYLERRNPKNLLISGVFIALAFMVKQTAIWPISATILYLFIQDFPRIGNIIKTCLYYLSPLFFIYLISLIYYAFAGSGREYFYWTILYTILDSGKTPYYFFSPSLSQLVYLAPAFLGIILIVLVFILNMKKRNIIRRTALYLVLFSSSMLMTSMPRFGLMKLLGALPFGVFTIGYFSLSAGKHLQNKKYFIFVALIILLMTGGSIKSGFKFYTQLDKSSIGFFGPRFMNLSEEIKPMVDNRDFFIFGNYDYLYIALNRKPTVTPFVFQAPWTLEADGLQNRIVSSLDAQKPAVVLYFPFHQGKLYYDDYLPKTLYDYIMAHYIPKKQLPGYGWIMVRDNRI